MRIIRLKIDQDTQLLLNDIAGRYRIDDPEFTHDLFALLHFKGHGLPEKRQIDTLAKRIVAAYPTRTITGTTLLISKRKMVFARLVSLAFFRALAGSKNLVDAVERLLKNFLSMYSKIRQAQCVSCHLRSQCAFGKQYGSTAADITKVVDADYSRKVHPDCPVMPDISAINKLFSVAETIKTLMAQQKQNALPGNEPTPDQLEAAKAQQDIENEPELGEDAGEDASGGDSSGVGTGSGNSEEEGEDDPDLRDPDNYIPPSGGYGRSSVFDAQFTNNHICRVSEQFIQQVTMQQLALYELGRKFEVALNQHSGTEFKPVRHVDKDKDLQQITGVSDITKVVASSHALPDTVFNRKLLKHELVKEEYRQPDDRKQLLYVLIDSSFSMCTGLVQGNNAFGLFTRGSLATIMSCALVRKVMNEKGILYARFFAGRPGVRMVAKTSDEFEVLLGQIRANDYNGGGTSIYAALKAADADIAAEDKDKPLAKATILVITDCDDYIDPTELEQFAKSREFNVLDCSGNPGQNAQLKKVAKKYYKVHGGALNVNELVKEVV